MRAAFDPRDWEERRQRRSSEVARERIDEAKLLLVQAERVEAAAETLGRAGNQLHVAFEARAGQLRWRVLEVLGAVPDSAVTGESTHKSLQAGKSTHSNSRLQGTAVAYTELR